MAIDAQLADQVRRNLAPPTLRIYRWNQPAISLGRRQSLDDLPAPLLSRGIPIVHRPTGGGAVVHRLDELTYALAISRSNVPSEISLHGLPGVIHRHLRDFLGSRGWVSPNELTIAEGHFRGSIRKGSSATVCFESPVSGDLLYRGQKVAGSALRVWRDGLLLQGSLQGFPLSRELQRQALLQAVSQTFGAIWRPPPKGFVRKERFELSRAKPIGF